MIESKVKVYPDRTEWRLNGKLHREDGPAIIRANGDKYWYLNDKKHRIDGPAIEWVSGYKAWYLNDKRHRENGPAIEWANGTKYWFRDDERHREDGPAIEYADGIKKWFLNGIELTEEEFNNRNKVVAVKNCSISDVMETPHLDEEIKRLESFKNPIYEHVKQLKEYKAIKKALSIPDVNQQREQLKAYTIWLNDKVRDEDELTELVNDFLKNYSIPDVSKSFLCGKYRVYGDEKCENQCSICKRDYNE